MVYVDETVDFELMLSKFRKTVYRSKHCQTVTDTIALLIPSSLALTRQINFQRLICVVVIAVRRT